MASGTKDKKPVRKTINGKKVTIKRKVNKKKK